MNHAVLRRSIGLPDDSSEIYSWADLCNMVDFFKHSEKNIEIFIYRHAKTVFNERNLVSGQLDIDLSDEGRASASLIKSYIPHPYASIYCSALRRAIHTMEIAIPETNFNQSLYTVEPRFNEVCLGRLEGTDRKYIPEFSNGDIDYAPAGGESYRQAARRIISGLVDLLGTVATRPDNGRSGPILIFAHAGTMRILASMQPSVDSAREMFNTNFKNQMSLRIKISEVCIPRFWIG